LLEQDGKPALATEKARFTWAWLRKSGPDPPNPQGAVERDVQDAFPDKCVIVVKHHSYRH
jgi:hypothetical protein